MRLIYKDTTTYRPAERSGEELWLRPAKVTETTAPGSMALGMGVSKEADQDKALVMEPVTSSRKLGRKEKTDPRLHTRNQVGIIATQAVAKVNGQGEKKTFDIEAENQTFDIDAENLKWKNMSPGRATQARHTRARPTQGAAVSPIAKGQCQGVRTGKSMPPGGVGGPDVRAY